MEIIRAFLSSMPEACRTMVLASEFSYWQIGGPVSLLVEPASVEQLADAIKIKHQFSDSPCVVIGDGSNLLFDSQGIEGVVIKIANALSKYQVDGCIVTCEAGIWVPELAFRVSSLGLSGLEHTCGIPGRLGGLVCMNGGSNRKSILESVESVTMINSCGEYETVKRTDINFSYRNSPFQHDERLIAQVCLHLKPSSRKAIRSSMRHILKSRRLKFPRKLPNCGSVFLSDPSMYDKIGPPGYAIEKAGLKGTRQGQAQISQLHANFIVNLGGASSNDVLYLIKLMRQKVYQQTAFLMDCEVRYVSPKGQLLPAHIAALAR